MTETYRYNKANWVILLENRNKKGVISSYAYTYYASGSQKTKTTAGGTVTSYVYDGLNRLIHEAETGALTQGYTYDARGNRASMTVSGKERYTVSYAYDANNRLLTERKTRGLLTDLTTYAYDANGNLLSKTFTGGDGSLTGATYTYNLFGQLTAASENGQTAAYAYNAQGIRTCKATATSQTYFLLDGGNVVGEHVGSKTVTYLRGANLISRSDGSKKTYYLFNAHGDVTELVSDSGTVTHKYDYDAFGVEKKPDPLDGNPFRYCGEYYDGETKTYYLRARYYDPNIGRFTQQDTHWTTANSIYGDNPQKINEREDKLGLKSYSYAPQITAVMQSGNLYVYGVGNPVLYQDLTGESIILASIIIGAAVGAAIGGLTAAAISNAQLGYVNWDWVLLGAGGGAVLGGLAGWGVGAALNAASASTALANSWLQYKAAHIATRAYAIGRTFEEWFYKAYNVVHQQVRYASYRFDAIYQNSIIELKNYDWSKYSSYTSLAKKFVSQARNYAQYVGQVIAGQKIESVRFIFSVKPPNEIIDALESLDIIVEWISGG